MEHTFHIEGHFASVSLQGTKMSLLNYPDFRLIDSQSMYLIQNEIYVIEGNFHVFYVPFRTVFFTFCKTMVAISLQKKSSFSAKHLSKLYQNYIGSIFNP